ncbi:MAG: GTPase HflX [Planctomycetota bacterium]
MGQPKERQDIQVKRERAVLAACYLPGDRFDERDPLGELRSLAETAGATVVGELMQKRDRPEAATYMGRGKVDELKAMCDELKAAVVIFDHELSPNQIAAIEKILEKKVIDRSELILDIFASRASTHQAKLAVELAQLEYTYPRLRAMWSHLERIVGSGGIGGVGTRGPGEQQLEIDRRIVQRKKTQLRRELDSIHARKTREVAHRNREHYTVGLVGYTNAGKSTLFNASTAGGAFANDQLFATLMTRTRQWHVRGAGGEGENVLLSDTVGFVRDLPHHLIASFRATLEEAMHADLLLIVLDVSDPNAELHYETVVRTLDELVRESRDSADKTGVDYREPERLVLLNKADQLRDRSELAYWQSRIPGSIAFAAVDPAHAGHADLSRRVHALTRGRVVEVDVTVATSDGEAVSLMERRSEVLDRAYDDGAVTYRARIGERQLDQLRARGARVAEPA